MRKSKSLTILNKKPQTIAPAQKQGNYDFINKEFSRYLKCTVCKELMISPTRLHPCAHTFCLKCAPKSGKCPTCNKKIVVVQPDLIGLSLINQMTVRCLNDGCPFKGSFEEYKKFHQNSCTLEKGIDEWLKKMKGTLEDNSNQFSRYKNSSDEQSGIKEAQKGQKIKGLIIPKTKLIVEKKQLEWKQDEEMLQKHIRKDLE